MPYDTPILGYRNNTANTLRLWKAEAPESFDFSVFNRGDYYGAVKQKVASENLSKVLYPNDEQVQGKELRLEQQYFFVVLLAAGHAAHPARSRRFRSRRFHEKFAVQLNDTHPAIAVAELMRLLVDEHVLPWERGLGHHLQTFALHQPHAAAGGARALAARAVRPRAAAPPRDHLRDQRALPRRGAHPLLGDEARLARLSLIDEHGERYVRMAQPRLRRQPRDQRRRGAALRAAEAGRAARFPRAVAGEVQQQDERRHAAPLAGAGNPRLARLITAGDRRRLDHAISTQLRELEPLADDAGVPRRVARRSSTPTRSRSRATCSRRTGMTLDPDSLFDVQVKRIHEYKRQHLNILHVIALYHPPEGRARHRRSCRARSSSAARPRPATTWPS